jgi:hypothetical protein
MAPRKESLSAIHYLFALCTSQADELTNKRPLVDTSTTTSRSGGRRLLVDDIIGGTAGRGPILLLLVPRNVVVVPEDTHVDTM